MTTQAKKKEKKSVVTDIFGCDTAQCLADSQEITNAYFTIAWDILYVGIRLFYGL